MHTRRRLAFLRNHGGIAWRQHAEVFRAMHHAHLHGNAVNALEQMWLQHFRRPTIGNDAPLKEEQTREIARGKVEVVHSGDDGYAGLAIETPHKFQRFDLVLYVKMRGRFVEQE